MATLLSREVFLQAGKDPCHSHTKSGQASFRARGNMSIRMAEACFRAGPLTGAVSVAGDKSISHRALILGAAAHGTTRILGPNLGADVLTTRDAIVTLGARVAQTEGGFAVDGGELRNLAATIDARNSGTTARLLIGLCAGRGIVVRFDGDASLRRRPMERVARPLRTLGAAVETTDGHLPVTVRGIRNPAGGLFALELPSAQLKSSILLANLDAVGDVQVTGDLRSRDHTERMLRRFGRDIAFDGEVIVLRPGRLRAADVHVPGDLSAGAFFLVAATVTPGSDLVVTNVGVNPTRSGFLDALRAMGARLEFEREREVDGEPVADIRAVYTPLRASDISGETVVRAIDEIPLLAVAGAFAEGVTTIRDAGELRTKESDRIAAIAVTLRACGIEAVELSDGLCVHGGRPKTPREPLRSFDDHRVAMTIAVIAAAAGPIAVDDARCIDISFPGFASLWASTQRNATSN
jgi:3-phosphoshikimate 1-carboxyvinyltransferase